MSTTQTIARATTIGETLRSQPIMAGFDWASLINLLVDLAPIIIKCFNPDDGAQAKQYVEKRWKSTQVNGPYGGYDKRLLKSMTRQVKAAAMKRHTRVTWDQARSIALSTLDSIRQDSEQQTSLIIAENFMLI